VAVDDDRLAGQRVEDLPHRPGGGLADLHAAGVRRASGFDQPRQVVPRLKKGTFLRMTYASDDSISDVRPRS
jgi:hypothetical protein